MPRVWIWCRRWMRWCRGDKRLQDRRRKTWACRPAGRAGGERSTRLHSPGILRSRGSVLECWRLDAAFAGRWRPVDALNPGPAGLAFAVVLGFACLWSYFARCRGLKTVSSHRTPRRFATFGDGGSRSSMGEVGWAGKAWGDSVPDKQKGRRRERLRPRKVQSKVGKGR
jgi:hypothetical protein